jgi:hypothetical protein
MASDSRHEDLERRAFELYEQRGGEHGHDWDDWLEAEREIRGAEAQSDRQNPRARRRRGVAWTAVQKSRLADSDSACASSAT